MKIGVITPSYNQGRFIEATIKSVIQQSHPIDYYAIYDSCSTDETAAVLAKYIDHPLVSKIVVERDTGQADAINRGFAEMPADIEVMAYLNSDDLLDTDAVKRAIEILENQADIDFVTGTRQMIGPNGRKGLAYRTYRRDLESMLIISAINQECCFWRRGLYVKAGNYVDTSFKFAMDHELWVRMAEVGWNPLFVDEIMGHFRIHPVSKTSCLFKDLGLTEVNRVRTKRGRLPITFDSLRQHEMSLRAKEVGVLRFFIYRILYQIQKRILLPFYL